MENIRTQTLSLFEAEIPNDHVLRRFIIQNYIEELEGAYGRPLFEPFDVDRLLFPTRGFAKFQIFETIDQAVEARRFWEEAGWSKGDSPLISAQNIFHQAQKVRKRANTPE